MASIVVGVESDQIAMQHTKEEFVSDRQNTINFAAGEWCVQEEANFDIVLAVTDLLTQHLW